MCACDCTTCAQANSCDIPVGDTGPVGPPGAQGLPGINGTNGSNGIDGVDGCSLIDVYISDGTDGNTDGDIIVTTGPTPTPCNQVINAGNILTTLTSSGSTLIPPGIIVMWSGPISSIPVGWQLADGTNGQPDLRGRFIASYLAGDPNFGAPLASGGTFTVTLQPNNIPAHTHGLGSYNVASTVTNDTHCHILFLRTSGTSVGSYRDAEYGRGSGQWANPTQGNCNTNSYTHSHTVSNTMSGVSGDGTPALTAPQGAPFSIIPLYFTLAYIIKL
jgi:microcystin-dependent protein